MNNIEIHVGDIVMVKAADGNGCYGNRDNYEIVNYSKFFNNKLTSGFLLTDKKDQQVVVKFIDEYNQEQYRRIYKSHIIEIIHSPYSNIKHATENYNYLIPLLTELNTT